jgi:hypothetical protein
MDLSETRQQRREILAYIKRQQMEDANCLGQIKAAALNGKRELLRALASWLSSIDSSAPISARSRQAFAKVTSRVSIDTWVELKRTQSAMNAALEAAQNHARRADAAYREAAPFGFLSNAFAEGPKKGLIQRLKSTCDDGLVARDSADRDFRKNEEALSVACEAFLRDSQLSDHLKAICEDPELAVFAVPILEMTQEQATDLWQAHAREHARHCVDLEAAARGLRAMYERSSTSVPKYLPGEDLRN